MNTNFVNMNDLNTTMPAASTVIGLDGESPRVGFPPEVITNISARSADDRVPKWNDTFTPWMETESMLNPGYQ